MQVYGLPHTPQKGFYATNLTHGLATPPITPDNDYGHATVAYGKAPQLVTQQYTAAATPPSSSGEQTQAYQYRPYHYALPQMQPQPMQPTMQQHYYMR